MNCNIPNIRVLILVCLFTNGFSTYSQNTTTKYSIDTKHFLRDFASGAGLAKYQVSFDYIYLYHSPRDKDKMNVKYYGHLISSKPTSINYDKYYELACSLWKLNKLEEAEKMFLNILASSVKYYSTTYDHSSDIPGDTTVNSYGYGSYTSNYKNSAAIYLTKIYIEKKKFEKAFKYLEDATKKYKVTFTCGTGYLSQKEEYNFLYACSYEGLKKYDSIVALLLPVCIHGNDKILVSALKKLYAPARIKEFLLTAENSIHCSFDSNPSYSYRTTYSSVNKTEKKDTLIYYSGSATVKLFDMTINIPAPDLENNEHVTREMFLKEFKESNFYVKLAKPARLSQHTTLQQVGAGRKSNGQ